MRVWVLCPDCQGLGARMAHTTFLFGRGAIDGYQAVCCSRCQGVGKLPSARSVTARSSSRSGARLAATTGSEGKNAPEGLNPAQTTGLAVGA